MEYIFQSKQFPGKTYPQSPWFSWGSPENFIRNLLHFTKVENFPGKEIFTGEMAGVIGQWEPLPPPVKYVGVQLSLAPDLTDYALLALVPLSGMCLLPNSMP